VSCTATWPWRSERQQPRSAQSPERGGALLPLRGRRRMSVIGGSQRAELRIGELIEEHRKAGELAKGAKAGCKKSGHLGRSRIRVTKRGRSPTRVFDKHLADARAKPPRVRRGIRDRSRTTVIWPSGSRSASHRMPGGGARSAPCSTILATTSRRATL
jgi:hypothetical protein